jgi:uncharacterized ParB-like nuclease family protein
MQNTRRAMADVAVSLEPRQHNRLADKQAAVLRDLSITAITADPDCQLRAACSSATVQEYAGALAAGATFPPIIVFSDGASYWLGDGFHRFEAHQSAGLTEINAEIRDGDQRDAKLFAAGANAAHGLRRTQADKRNAILALLTDTEWRRWSDKEIARRTATSDKTVAKVRRELSGDGVNAEIRVEERTFITKYGTEAKRRVPTKPSQNNDGLVERVLRGLPDDVLMAEVRRRRLVEGLGDE